MASPQMLDLDLGMLLHDRARAERLLFSSATDPALVESCHAALGSESFRAFLELLAPRLDVARACASFGARSPSSRRRSPAAKRRSWPGEPAKPETLISTRSANSETGGPSTWPALSHFPLRSLGFKFPRSSRGYVV